MSIYKKEYRRNTLNMFKANTKSISPISVFPLQRDIPIRIKDAKTIAMQITIRAFTNDLLQELVNSFNALRTLISIIHQK